MMENGFDLFATFFGDFGFPFANGGGGNQEAPLRANVVMDVMIKLKHLYTSTFVEITRNKPVMKAPHGTRATVDRR